MRDAILLDAAAELAASLGDDPTAPAYLRGALFATASDLPRLAEACRVELLRQTEFVEDERRYALVRTIYGRLRPGVVEDGIPPYLGEVSVAERDEVIQRLLPGGPAASVAIPLVRLPGTGYAVSITRRSSINGYTGGPMSNADEVVLFGGAGEPGELPAVTAVRELLEESGLADPLGNGFAVDFRFDPFEEIGAWTTEAGFRARGFLVNVPDEFPGIIVPDRREVADVGFIDLDELYGAELRERPHHVVGLDRHRKPRFVGSFLSPTCTVTDVDGKREWALWGLAGHMVRRLRKAYPAADELRTAADARRAARSGRADSVGDFTRVQRHRFAVAAAGTRSLMRRLLDVPRAELVHAEVLSELLGEPGLLLMECLLPLGNSSKVRALSGLVYGLLEAACERRAVAGLPAPGADVEELRSLLGETIRGTTLIAASTGSHARAVVQLVRWLNDRTGADARAEIFLSSDI
ncbi:MAG TPA: NUDIX domain-containing protein, partial [Streptomyces sp.]|nr:NUDIX domain-containing protein [Streptomyces sp.]